MTSYRFTLYHDDGDDPGADTYGSELAGFETPEAAVEAAQKRLTDYWTAATVERGTFTAGVLGEYPDDWERDLDWTPIYIADGIVDDPRTYRS